MEDGYILWAYAMELSGGCGAVETRDLIDALNADRMFGPRQARRLLTPGTFWTVAGDRIFLMNTVAVANLLGGGGGWRYQWSIERLRTRAQRRAALMATAIPFIKPVAQDTITTITGIPARTQRRLRATGNFGVTPQWGERTTGEMGPGSFRKGGRIIDRLANQHSVHARLLRAGSVTKRRFSRPRTLDATGGTAGYVTSQGERYHRVSRNRWLKPLDKTGRHRDATRAASRRPSPGLATDPVMARWLAALDTSNVAVPGKGRDQHAHVCPTCSVGFLCGDQHEAVSWSRIVNPLWQRCAACGPWA